IEWQPLSPRHGYAVPPAVEEAGLSARYHDAMARSAGLYDALVGRFPAQAPYAISLAYRVRYAMQLNVREAMHMLELRTTPQGHPGDNLEGIAGRFGTAPSAIASANKIRNRNLVIIGTKLTIPAPTAGSGTNLPARLVAHPERLALTPRFDYWARTYGVPADLL